MAWEKRLIFKPPRVFPMLFTREMVYPHVNYWKKGPHHHNNNTGPTFLNLKKGTARVPYKVLGGRWKPTTPFWLDNRSDMTVISPVVAGADWSADLVRFRLIILISRRWSQERESEREREREKKKAEARQERWSLAWTVVSTRTDDHWLREECLKTRGRDWKPFSGRSTRRPSWESSTSWKRGERNGCG